jgi:hypothetical protein
MAGSRISNDGQLVLMVDRHPMASDVHLRNLAMEKAMEKAALNSDLAVQATHTYIYG